MIVFLWCHQLEHFYGEFNLCAHTLWHNQFLCSYDLIDHSYHSKSSILCEQNGDDYGRLGQVFS